MKIDIEEIAEEKGKAIAGIIFEKYGEEPVINHKSFWGSFMDSLLGGGYSRMKVEKEIYERCLQEATAFFLEHRESKFDEKILNTIKSRLSQALENPKGIKKMNPEEMLANFIKICAINTLSDKGLYI